MRRKSLRRFAGVDKIQNSMTNELYNQIADEFGRLELKYRPFGSDEGRIAFNNALEKYLGELGETRETWLDAIEERMDRRQNERRHAHI